MPDSTLEVQKAIVAALKADAGVIAVVGARVYDRPPQNVEYPYIRFGFSDAEPFEGQSMDGWRQLVTLEHWSRKYGRVECEQSMSAAYAALHDVPLTLDTQTWGYMQLVGAQTLPQGDGITTLGRQRWEIITTE